MKAQTTKSALLTSAMALLLCFAMLLGTTFAWFTDTASTGVNKIQAGNLDVQLLDEAGNSLEGKTLKWIRSTGSSTELADSNDILWEPGCTYKLQPITIKNAGNLNLKYKIVINGIQGDAPLNDAIVWTIEEKDVNQNVLTTALNADHTLAPGAYNTLTIQGHMKEDAGNEYQGLSIDGIGITVYATQLEAEFDSIDNSYDHDADYIERHSTIMGADGKTITLEKNKEYIVGNAKVVVDGSGNVTYTTINSNLPGQTVTIKTDGGSLTVNADKDTIYHYGETGEVNIIAVAGNSYHEFGKVAVMSLAKGRVVVENGDNIGKIQVPSSADTPVIAVPENVVLNTKIERADSIPAFKLDVLDSNGNAIEAKSKVIDSSETPAAPSDELATVLGTGGIANEIKTYVARIGNKPYETLAAAVEAAQTDETVILLKNAEVTETVAVSKTITLNLAGNTITGKDVRAFNVKGGTLTLTGSGTVTSVKSNALDPASSVIRVGDNSGETRTAGLVIDKNVIISAPNTYGVTVFGNKTTETVTVKGTINAKPAAAISGNGSAGYGDTAITIEPTAVLTSEENAAIYHPQSGTLTINGGSITGVGGIEAKAGNTSIVVSGNPTITATGEVDHEANSNGTSTSGYAIAVVENSAYAGGASVTIGSGTFNGAIGIVEDNAVSDDKKGSISITGGTFTVGSEAALNALLSYIAEDASNVTINLASDISLAAPIQVSKNVTINGQNHTITSGVFDSFKVTGTVNFALKNLTIESQYRNTVDGVEATTQTGSKLSFENVTINNAEKAIYFSGCQQTAVSIKGCTLSSLYPFNVSGGTITSFTVEDSQLNGWTSFNKLANGGVFQFKNCSFGEKFGYATLKPYGDTTFEGCTISEEFFKGLESGIASGTETPITVNFNKCFVKASDGTTQALTIDLLKTAFNYDITSGSSSGASTINKQYWFVNGEQIAFEAKAE